jgi:excisionase family DNA binding protein
MASKTKTKATGVTADNSGRPRKPFSTNPGRKLQFEDRLLTRAEAADILGVNERWIKRAIALHYFPRVKVGRLIRVRLSDLHAYIEAQSNAAEPQ